MTGTKDQNVQQSSQDQQSQAQPGKQQSQAQQPQDTPAPRYSAAESVTRLQQRQQQQAKDKNDPGLPGAAQPVNIADAKFVPLPAGGVAALADSLYPDDKDNQDAMDQHVFDILVANRDVIRDDVGSTVGTMVRIP